MHRYLLAAASILAASAFAVPAQASHIFVTNVGIGGTALDSTTGPTNPVFNVTQGGSLNFTGDMLGSGDSLVVTINGVAGLSQNVFMVPFAGGNASFSQAIGFNTVGSFNGLVTYDFPSSTPDYLDPNGGQHSDRTLGFSVNVLAGNGAVPEPATWLMLILGFGAVGAGMRRAKGVRTAVSFA